ncbi:MAG TPA: hypothetical protein VHB47_18700 [Thermoanaerobaculia bacterium]|jgi:hypothetical protein|nr:hypothetical protein [Thermoanaerobaculia bacterium]
MSKWRALLWESGLKAGLEELWKLLGSNAFRWVVTVVSAASPFAAWYATVRGLFSQAWFHGFLTGFSPLLGVLLVAIAAHHIQNRRRRAAIPPVATEPLAPVEGLQRLRQLHFNYWSKAAESACGYLTRICALADAESEVTAQMASLLRGNVLEPCIQTRDEFAREIQTSVPGKLSDEGFAQLKEGFTRLTWKYNCVAMWSRLTWGSISGDYGTRQQDFDRLRRLHKEFTDGLRHEKGRTDLDEITRHLETLEQQLPELAPTDPMPSKALEGGHQAIHDGPPARPVANNEGARCHCAIEIVTTYKKLKEEPSQEERRRLQGIIGDLSGIYYNLLSEEQRQWGHELSRARGEILTALIRENPIAETSIRTIARYHGLEDLV